MGYGGWPDLCAPQLPSAAKAGNEDRLLIAAVKRSKSNSRSNFAALCLAAEVTVLDREVRYNFASRVGEPSKMRLVASLR